MQNKRWVCFPGELRVAQYEKPLEKGHRTTLKERREKVDSKRLCSDSIKFQDPEKLAKRRTEKKERSAVLKV